MVAAAETTIRKLFEGTTQYQVPLYQRPYQWEKKHWKQLWDDLMELIEGRRDGSMRTHFLGSLVLTPPPAAVAGRVSRHLVVDGQQRLTTLAILLAALRDSAAFDQQLYAQINEEYLINRFEKSDGRLKLLPTQADRRAFQELVEDGASVDTNSHLREAYSFFEKNIGVFVEEGNHQEHAINELLDAITEGLSVVSISTHSDDNVHRIFQSLNNTGLKLTQGDLLRNYIFMLLPKRGEEVYKRFWLPMQQSLENNQIENLFWIALAGTNPTAKIDDTFVVYQRRLDGLHTEDQVVAEAQRLSALASIYKLMVNPEREADPVVAKRLRRLGELGTAVPHPLVLEILQRREEGTATEGEAAEALLVIEAFLVRRAFMGKVSQGLNRLFREAVAALNSEEPLDKQLRRWFSEGRRFFFTDTELFSTVPTVQFFKDKNSKRPKILLSWLEEEYNSKEPVDTKTLTIEHVMPQTLSETWIEQLEQTSLTEPVEQLHSEYVHTIGNLTLTGYNSELSNKPFEWKKTQLATSGVQLSRSIAQQDSWDFEKIQQRSTELAELICRAWPGPVEAHNHELSPLWQRLVHIVENLPEARWTSYGELAKAIGGGGG